MCTSMHHFAYVGCVSMDHFVLRSKVVDPDSSGVVAGGHDTIGRAAVSILTPARRDLAGSTFGLLDVLTF